MSSARVRKLLNAVVGTTIVAAAGAGAGAVGAVELKVDVGSAAQEACLGTSVFLAINLAVEGFSQGLGLSEDSRARKIMKSTALIASLSAPVLSHLILDAVKETGLSMSLTVSTYYAGWSTLIGAIVVGALCLSTCAKEEKEQKASEALLENNESDFDIELQDYPDNGATRSLRITSIDATHLNAEMKASSTNLAVQPHKSNDQISAARRSAA